MEICQKQAAGIETSQKSFGMNTQTDKDSENEKQP